MRTANCTQSLTCQLDSETQCGATFRAQTRKRKSAAPLWSWLQNGSNNTLTMKTFFFSVLHCFHSTQFLLLTSGHLSHHQSWLSCEEKRESWGVLVTCDGPSSASSCLHPMHGNYAEGWRPQTRQKLKCGVGESKRVISPRKSRNVPQMGGRSSILSEPESPSCFSTWVDIVPKTFFQLASQNRSNRLCRSWWRPCAWNPTVLHLMYFSAI